MLPFTLIHNLNDIYIVKHSYTVNVLTISIFRLSLACDWPSRAPPPPTTTTTTTSSSKRPIVTCLTVVNKASILYMQFNRWGIPRLWSVCVCATKLLEHDGSLTISIRLTREGAFRTTEPFVSRGVNFLSRYQKCLWPKPVIATFYKKKKSHWAKLQ